MKIFAAAVSTVLLSVSYIFLYIRQLDCVMALGTFVHVHA